MYRLFERRFLWIHHSEIFMVDRSQKGTQYISVHPVYTISTSRSKANNICDLIPSNRKYACKTRRKREKDRIDFHVIWRGKLGSGTRRQWDGKERCYK